MSIYNYSLNDLIGRTIRINILHGTHAKPAGKVIEGTARRITPDEGEKKEIVAHQLPSCDLKE